ncbi:MAG: 3-hydroxyacyl-CoA dehydrogenase NAD-binding domain-containing protein, partial [Kofleriaceae bacterium]
MIDRTASEVRTLTVIGAGTMGHGIAHVAAIAGIEVRLFDAASGAAATGITKIGKNLDKGVELGKLAPIDREAALGRLRPFDDLAAACTGADGLIEAIPEKLELKREVFAAVDRAAPAHALFATNTSSLPVGEIAASVREPARLVGMHFF